MPKTHAATPRVVLVGVQLPGVSDVDHAGDLAELGRLVHTLGYEVVATVTQKRDGLKSGTVLGEGKLKELAALTGGTGEIASGAPDRTSKAREKWEQDEEEEETEPESDSAEAPEGEARPSVVVVDHELSPSQARNLERATRAQVLDRTGVIVDIFHRHAKSREARMQVEIARLNYVAPRMRESAGGTERQQGRGAGESALELDRRKIRDRIAELKEQLALIQADQDHRRYARKDQLRVALVGYTNAGKSSLMRALTGSEVYVADRLFATLDTTVRALQPETRPRILVSDTVGFIKKLPHDLVASFKSTLDEALDASLLLHVIDASDPGFERQLEVTDKVLEEIGASDVPRIRVFNKIDHVGDAAAQGEREAGLRAHYPACIVMSARRQDDIAKLHDAIVSFFQRDHVEAELFLPWSAQQLRAKIFASCEVLEERAVDEGAFFRVRGEPEAVNGLREQFGQAQ
jgi:GTP-binding protein HflX